MTEVSVYGPCVTGTQVSSAVIETLKEFFPSYLADAERRTGRDPGALSPPRSWTRSPVLRQVQGAQLPQANVIATGTDGPPERHGDRSYSAWLGIEVAIIVNARDADSALDLAQLYAAVLTLLIADKPGLGSSDGSRPSIASDARWLGWDWDRYPADFVPNGAVGGAAFNFLVHGVVTPRGGPAVPDVDPETFAQIETVLTTTERIA